MNTYKSYFLFSMIFILGSIQGFGQTNPNEIPLKIGDEVTFARGEDAKRFVIIDMEGSKLTCAVLNDEEKVDTVSMKRMAIVGAYPKPINRKRMSMLLPDTKLKWRQRGVLTEGILIHYSPADPKLTARVYLDDRVEDRRVPVKYATPTFGPSRIDTLRMLCKLWESKEQMLSYDPDDMKEQGLPMREEITLTKTRVAQPYQYVMEDFKFAAVTKKDLNSGIVGSWKLKDELLYIVPKYASVYDEVEEKNVPSPCPAELAYEWSLSADGNTLKLKKIDFVEPDLGEEEPEDVVEEEIEDEAITPGEQEEEEDVAEQEKPVKTKPKKEETTSEELERVRAELEALKKEFRMLREAIKEKTEEN